VTYDINSYKAVLKHLLTIQLLTDIFAS